jgi:anti-sigma-K factor RskA
VKLLRHDLHTLTGVYALDAIDGAERERFEHHLHRCQPCDHEVRGLQETATRLAVAAARVPPPDLKVAVLTAAARTRQHPPLSDVRSLPEPRTRWRPRLAGVVAAAATAVAIALGVTLGVQHGELSNARAQQRQVAAVLNATDARIVTARTSLGGTVTVVVASRLHELVYTTSGLPALSHARVYQLWLMGPSANTSAGLLPRGSGGSTAPLLAAGLARGDRFGVTVEPAGGSKQPTTKPIVAIPVSS